MNSELRTVCRLLRSALQQLDALAEKADEMENIILDTAAHRSVTVPVWCDECFNFQKWEGNSDPPDDYNPCGLGRRPKFHSPESPVDSYGFYRINCGDFEADTSEPPAGREVVE